MVKQESNLTTSHNLPLAKRRVSRRQLLIGGAVGTGLVIGFLAWPRSPVLNVPTKNDETLLNGWLKIGADGRVVVIVPQAEMGQGVYTSLPLIVAEELGADWKTVSVEPAPLHPIYANTVVTAEGADALPEFLHGIAKWFLKKMSERYAVQVTGGSTSVRAFYQSLRIAGASARVLLCKAAARKWDVDWHECDIRDGYVIYRNKQASFSSLAALAVEEELPDEVPLKKSADFTLIGKSPPRVDIPSKVDGSARYGLDVRLPDMMYAAVKGGPVNGAALTKVDRKLVQDQRGAMPVVSGPTWVAVVADSWWRAQSALEKIVPSFDLENVTSVNSITVGQQLDQALREGKARVYEQEQDIQLALEGNSVVQADYRVPFLAHACMEPMNATARIENGIVEVWAPTQSVTIATWAVARVLDLPIDAVSVYPTLVGGGFGRKAEVDAIVQAALIARSIGKPVQVVWSREEDIRQDKFRPAVVSQMKARLDSAGTVFAWHHRLAGPSVSESYSSRAIPFLATDEPDPSSVQGAYNLPYDFQARQVEHVAINIPIPSGFWRSVGHSSNAFFVESFVDELALSAGQDPLAFRLKLLKRAPRHAAVLKQVALKANYGAPLPKNHGRGIALHESFDSIVAQVVEVMISGEAELVVKRVTCAIDCGPIIHPDTVIGQMEGSIIFGLTAALMGEITFDKGFPVQSNFDSYPLLPLAQCPQIDVVLMPNDKAPLGGVGEPGVPPVAPALTNAIAAATGVRLRSLPINGQKLI